MSHRNAKNEREVNLKSHWEIEEKKPEANMMKKNKEQFYEDEYQKVKQNLFSCLNQNAFDNDSEE